MGWRDIQAYLLEMWSRSGIYLGRAKAFEWTGWRKKMKLTVSRRTKTADGIFGKLTIDTSLFTCFTCENLAKAIPTGEYKLVIDYSPRFNRRLPHLIVPGRDEAAGGDAGIRIHWGNNPSDYTGCLGLGNGQEGDSIDNTVDTFNRFYAIIKDCQDMTIAVVDDFI